MPATAALVTDYRFAVLQYQRETLS